MSENGDIFAQSFNTLINQQKIEHWKSASRATVENTCGQAYVIFGEKRREGNIYSQVEREVLSNNTNINQKVMFINPKTCKIIGTCDKTNLLIWAIVSSIVFLQV
ncbi:MAG: hypothetical protein FWH37_01620 [Candidatus Bathyarchaeota archaeon]|nr:hypothetical protein [Candidatus Termiticorpusculum sp.]